MSISCVYLLVLFKWRPPEKKTFTKMYTVFMKKVVYLEGSFGSGKILKISTPPVPAVPAQGYGRRLITQPKPVEGGRQERAEQHLCSEFQVPEDGEGAAGRGHQCSGHDQAHYKKNRNFHRLKEKPMEIKQFLSARASRRKLL
jgi:hypothetical protein